MSLSTGGHADRIRELIVHFKDFVDYHDYKEEQFGNEGGLENDFRIILVIMIIRLDTAVHYAQTVKGEGAELVPPVWKKVLRAQDQKKEKRVPKGSTSVRDKRSPSSPRS